MGRFQPHFAAVIHYLSTLSHLSYTGIFIAILLSGHVIPLPESIELILLGYLSAAGDFVLWKICIVAMLSTATYDIAVYLIARGGSELAERMSKKVKPALLERYRNAEERHLLALTFVSHFVPGWRFANPIILGITQVSLTRFLLYTLIAVALYAPILVLIGYFFLGHV